MRAPEDEPRQDERAADAAHAPEEPGTKRASGAPSAPVLGGRLLKVVLSVAVGIAAVGFLTGTRELPVRGGYHAGEAPVSADRMAARAPKQRDMEGARYGARRAQQRNALLALATPPRASSDPVALDPSAYARNVAARAEGRAYDGAPPTIPHAVDQRGAPACLTCHAEGLRVEAKVARPLSHAAFGSCLQCHTTREPSLPTRELLPATVAEASTFAGLASPGHGQRAWPGAPPQMPHRAFMRERCASCHGVWAEGIASSHPHRQSCTQCHAPAGDTERTGWPQSGRRSDAAEHARAPARLGSRALPPSVNAGAQR